MKPKLFTVLALLLTFSTVSEAQMARLYTSGSGLPNSKIYNITQDSDGFIWIPTENGLARYDGINFATFRRNKLSSNTIASNFSVKVLEDSYGTYWVGTSAGLQTFNKEYNSFKDIPLGDNEVPASIQHISDILQTDYLGKDRILAATSGYGIYIIDPQNHKTDSLLHDGITSLLPSKFVKKMFTDSRGRLWIATESSGIRVIELSSGKDITPEMGREYNEINVSSFIENTRTGDIIIGSSSHGILICEDNTGRIRHAKDLSAKGLRVESMLENNIAPHYGESTYLIGVENSGIWLFDAVSEKVSRIYLPNVPYDTSSWKIHSMMEDSQGNVWLGAYHKGVLVIPKSMHGFRYTNLTEDNGGDNGVCVTSVTMDKESGDIWVGTDGTGLFRIGKDRKKTHYSTENSALTNNSIMALTMDKRGTLWIATYLGGLFSWTERTGFRQFSGQSELDAGSTMCLAYSPEQDLLFVGTHGNGMSIISLPEGKVVRTFAEDANKWISDLYVDRHGKLWVGTYNGPMWYDHRNRNLVSFELTESLKPSVQSFCETSDGKMWIGTGEGLICFDKSTGKADTYTENDGLANNYVTEMREGNDGNLWIATLNGLSRFSPSTKTFKNYYHYDGLQENEFHTGASYLAEDGRMYFGGINGLTSFYPHVVDRHKHPVPPLYFSDLRVMNEPVEYNPEPGHDNILDKHITQASSITLPNDRNMFSLMFSVLEYTNPQKIAYDYMVEGFDDDWNHTNSSLRTVTYTNIPPGRYTFKVKAFFDGDPQDYSYREIGIRILPPWCRGVWASLLYLACLILIFIWIYRYRQRLAIQKKEKEESEIKEMKLKMFTNISHEIRTPLTLVMSPLKKMREAETDPKQKELYNLMYRNSLRILRMVNQLLDMRKVDNGQMKLHFVETDVVYFIRDIMKSFDNLAGNKSISFTIDSESEVTSLWIDQGNFDKIIFNILSNAFKYTPEGGSISIHVSGRKKNSGILKEAVKEYVEFTIENSGSNVDERYLDKVFDRFFQADVRDARVGSGVGLNLTKMLVGLHHGDIHAYNTDEGMAFSVRIPAGNVHLTAEEMTQPTNHKDLYIKMPEIKEHLDSREDVTHAPVKEDNKRQAKTKRNIVLIDDDSEMRAYLNFELQGTYNIVACSNGKDAWSMITKNLPDLVITDLIMEGMNGAELCEKVKKNPETNHIPVIILTSSHDENSQQKCIDSGADRFLTKPISLEILKSTIAHAISTRDIIRNKFNNKEIDYKFNEIKLPDTSNKLANKVVEIIRQNMENTDFSVEDLSREVGMSRVHLNRKLKETMNISPSNLIKSIRLKQAAFLLINNKVNISEVAYKVGFSTHSYFSNSFHDYFGMTPKEFIAKYMDCKDEETLKRIFE